MVSVVAAFLAGFLVGGMIGIIGMAAAVVASDRRDE